MTYVANTEGVAFDFDGSLTLARRLWAMGDDLTGHRATMEDAGARALSDWLGVYGEHFRGRRWEEDVNFGVASETLREEAQAWAVAWKQAMDEVNRRRRARAVQEEQASRSLLERAADVLWHGDDSDRVIPPVQPVPVPSPPGFAPTGGPQQF